MKNQASYALVFAVAYIVVKNTAYIFGFENTESGKLIGLISLLFVLLTIFLTLKDNRKSNPNPHFLSEVKIGAKAGGIYSLIAAVYVVFHFSFISPNLNLKLNEIVTHQTRLLNSEFFDSNEVITVDEKFRITLNSEVDYSKYETSYIDEKVMMLKTAIDQAKLVYRPMVYGTITLIGLMILTFLYSIGVAFLLRKLPSI